jgi:hypothetical protein
MLVGTYVFAHFHQQEDPMVDVGRINERILKKEATKDYLTKVESASKKIATRLCTPEIKRLFLRYFDSLQLTAHFISRIARAKLPHDVIEKVEEQLARQLKEVTDEINISIDNAELRLKSCGVAQLTSYDELPLDLDVKVISRFGRQYHELLEKADQLIQLLESLCIEDVITKQDLDGHKALIRKNIKGVVFAARTYADGLRGQMNVSRAEVDEHRAAHQDAEVVIDQGAGV